MSRNWLIRVCLVDFILLATARATSGPICVKQGKSDVVCSPGDTDYTLKRGLVSDNNMTTGIILRGCKIVSIDMESFHNLPSLEYLDLSVNHITTLRLGVLDGTNEVKLLNLSHNSITELPLGLFDQKPNLEVLDLKGNKITILILGILDPLSKLRHLDLSSNPLMGRNINPYVFDKTRNIRFVDFSRNNMIDAPDNLLYAFQDIDFLNLDRCLLKEVPNFAINSNLRTMKHLMLSTNLINKLDNPTMFIHLDNIQILNFAENSIDSIHADIFKSLKYLKVIDLRKNKLKTIPDTLFENMPKLINLHLSQNKIEFLPVSAFRRSSIKTLNVGGNKLTYLTDNFCLELKNSGTNLKKFYFGDNPWQCACLLELLAEVRQMGIAYNSDKYNGQIKVCVMQDIHCHRHNTSNIVFQEMFNNLIN